uniref:Uncharacterized protein n=1 Tax=Angiostrongylus cantonensis TaxID=6313 RepID=A0A0K0DBA0_ANGCA
MIFWSMESPYHRDFGKNYFKGTKLRTTGGSQLMSFLILGAVVGFIIYVYLAHVIMLRKLKRQSKTMELRKIVQRYGIRCVEYSRLELDQLSPLIGRRL